ncbi:dystrophin-like isoform X2 [Rhodnius prolixus]|uniref:dystrophin-like isoform X2 n=1 Tax=Rhodnius prolixus TaxID=13249 RepID=UPI003D18CFD8
MAFGNDITLVRYKQILEDVQSCNCIRYAAYRTAAKLDILQKNLGLDRVGLTLIKRVFEQHKILSTDLYLTLSEQELEDILYDIFFATSKVLTRPFDINLSVSLTKYFLTNVCQSTKNEKLAMLLNALLNITEYLSEQNTFSRNLLQPTLDSCFKNNYCSLGINENDFLNWILQEPQLLVWVSTFYRLSTSENVMHDVHCAVCGIHPIIGLRYHCLRCIRYNLCQICFFTGKTSKRHKSSHIIREYCAKTSAYESTITFLRGFINRLCGHKSRLQYLPVESQDAVRSAADVSEECIVTERTEKFIDTSTIKKLTNLTSESSLERIIQLIELESKLIQDAIDSNLTLNVIRQHVTYLRQHLNRLKVLQTDLKKNKITSTPMRFLNNFQTDLSPITTNKQTTLDSINSIDEFQHLFQSPSGFSTWIEKAGGLECKHPDNYSKQLEEELDIVMEKLNNMLQTSFTSVNEVDNKQELNEHQF